MTITHTDSGIDIETVLRGLDAFAMLMRLFGYDDRVPQQAATAIRELRSRAMVAEAALTHAVHSDHCDLRMPRDSFSEAPECTCGADAE